MRSLPWIAAGVVASSLVACGAPEPAGLPQFSQQQDLARPNVLIVLVDALRRDHLGIYGYDLPTSPNIDRFGAASFRFDRAYSHSTWTKPSVATLFTSVYPEQHGLGRVGFQDDRGFQTDVLPRKLGTLAERLRRNGYITGGFSTNVHIGRKTGFAQGFDHFFWKRLVDAYDLNTRLERWIDSVEPDKPFFAYLHYMDAHWPYDRRLEGASDRFGSTQMDPPPPEHWTRVAAWAEEHLNHESLAAIVASYDEEIAFIDGAFGELIEWLGGRGLLEETIVVLVADHGEGFNEHGELQHGYAPYEEVTAVPLLFKLPPVFGSVEGSSDSAVGLVDVMPTILDLVDIEAPKRAQGRSLVPMMVGKEMRDRPVYVEGVGYRGMRGRTHSLLVSAEGEEVCFDIVSDPEEAAPLPEPLPDECGRLGQATRTLLEQLELLGDSGDPDATVTLDEEEVEALRALGYLD